MEAIQIVNPQPLTLEGAQDPQAVSDLIDRYNSFVHDTLPFVRRNAKDLIVNSDGTLTVTTVDGPTTPTSGQWLIKDESGYHVSDDPPQP